tara:strand:- start:24855 stop:25214 length:360 start_codon:yes stop_codon:yes gene_type:complete
VKIVPVLKKEIELNDGKKIWVRQASGMDKLAIEKTQAQTLRTFRHFGANPSEWTDEQHAEFGDALTDAGGGIDGQIASWVPVCILDEEVDINTLTSQELRTILEFVRGDDVEGAVPLAS